MTASHMAFISGPVAGVLRSTSNSAFTGRAPRNASLYLRTRHSAAFTTRTPWRASAVQAGAPTSERLASLRSEMRARGVHAFVVPSGDPHASEYAPHCFARRAFISNFTGSAGTAVVTLEKALLWTDGRYFLQAENELDENWTLMRGGVPETPSIEKFLAKELAPGSSVGIDPFVHSIDATASMKTVLADADCELVPLSGPNPVDVTWSTARPAAPDAGIRLHDVRYAGLSISEKLETLREAMVVKECDHMLVSMLDEVAWVFNIRGADIPHCPVVLSYGLIAQDSAYLYIDEAKVDDSVRSELKKSGVCVLPYEQVLADVRKLASTGDSRVWLDPSSTSLALSEAAGDAGFREATPVPLAKACKNEAELNGMREAHIRDGVALSSFLCWLEDVVRDGGVISEADAALKLEEFRRSQDGFLTTSFGTIAGSGPNGAIIHYSAVDGDCSFVSDKEVFLLDSGGQYTDGTTDVTRTMHLGANATDHERECYTRVLQGHISIDTAIFPEDTTGFMLDTLARVPLWKIGLDYRHGTGHGVGACLNVHEGPQSISPRIGSNKAGIKQGMILSNEPGYYENGSFGIRIENLLIVEERSTPHGFGGKKYLGFERLTHVPIDTNMILPSLMSVSETFWLNEYHEQVWNVLSPRMTDGRCKEWLWEKTRPLAHDAIHALPSPATATSESLASPNTV